MKKVSSGVYRVDITPYVFVIYDENLLVARKFYREDDFSEPRHYDTQSFDQPFTLSAFADYIEAQRITIEKTQPVNTH